MNFIDIIFLFIIAIIAIIGYFKGLVLSLLSFFRFILAVPFSVIISNTFYQGIYDRFVRDALISGLMEKIDSAVSVTDYLSSAREFLNRFGGDMNLSSLNSMSAQSIATQLTDSVFEPIACTVIQLLLFLFSLILFYVVTGIIIRLVKKASGKKRGILSVANRILGGMLGLLKSFALILTLAAIFQMILNIDYSVDTSGFLKELEESAVIEFVNRFNPLFTFFMEV